MKLINVDFIKPSERLNLKVNGAHRAIKNKLVLKNKKEFIRSVILAPAAEVGKH